MLSRLRESLAENGAVPFKGCVAGLTSGNGPESPVMQLIQDGSGEGDETHPVVVDVSGRVAREHFRDGGEAGKDITEPVEC